MSSIASTISPLCAAVSLHKSEKRKGVRRLQNGKILLGMCCPESHLPLQSSTPFCTLPILPPPYCSSRSSDLLGMQLPLMEDLPNWSLVEHWKPLYKSRSLFCCHKWLCITAQSRIGSACKATIVYTYGKKSHWVKQGLLLSRHA